MTRRTPNRHWANAPGARNTRYRRPSPRYGSGKGGETCLLTLVLWGALSAAFAFVAVRLARK